MDKDEYNNNIDRTTNDAESKFENLDTVEVNVFTEENSLNFIALGICSPQGRSSMLPLNPFL